jgi:hypothetical protein
VGAGAWDSFHPGSRVGAKLKARAPLPWSLGSHTCVVSKSLRVAITICSTEAESEVYSARRLGCQVIDPGRDQSQVSIVDPGQLHPCLAPAHTHCHPCPGMGTASTFLDWVHKAAPPLQPVPGFLSVCPNPQSPGSPGLLG